MKFQSLKISTSDLKYEILFKPAQSRFSEWFEHRGLISNIEIIFIRLSAAHIYFRICGRESFIMRYLWLITYFWVSWFEIQVLNKIEINTVNVPLLCYDTCPCLSFGRMFAESDRMFKSNEILPSVFAVWFVRSIKIW